MQGTRSKVDFLAPVTEAEVVETITSFLRRCPFLARDILLYSDLSGRSQNKWDDSGLCKPCWQRWEHRYRRLGWSLSGLALRTCSSLVILSCLYVLWIKVSQPITYLELQGKLHCNNVTFGVEVMWQLLTTSSPYLVWLPLWRLVPPHLCHWVGGAQFFLIYATE